MLVNTSVSSLALDDTLKPLLDRLSDNDKEIVRQVVEGGKFVVQGSPINSGLLRVVECISRVFTVSGFSVTESVYADVSGKFVVIDGEEEDVFFNEVDVYVVRGIGEYEGSIHKHSTLDDAFLRFLFECNRRGVSVVIMYRDTVVLSDVLKKQIPVLGFKLLRVEESSSFVEDSVDLFWSGKGV